MTSIHEHGHESLWSWFVLVVGLSGEAEDEASRGVNEPLRR